MRICRFFGTLLVLVGLAVLAGPGLSVLAQGKDGKKEAKTEDKKETKADEKKAESKTSDSKWEWKAFDKKVNPEYYQTLETTTNQTMKVMSMEVKQVQSQTFYIKWTPQDPDAKGNWVVKQRIVDVKMDIDIGGNKIAYDSTAPGQP